MTRNARYGYPHVRSTAQMLMWKRQNSYCFIIRSCDAAQSSVSFNSHTNCALSEGEALRQQSVFYESETCQPHSTNSALTVLFVSPYHFFLNDFSLAEATYAQREIFFLKHFLLRH